MGVSYKKFHPKSPSTLERKGKGRGVILLKKGPIYFSDQTTLIHKKKPQVGALIFKNRFLI